MKYSYGDRSSAYSVRWSTRLRVCFLESTVGLVSGRIHSEDIVRRGV